MFTRKKKKIEVPTIETRTVTVPTAQGLKDMITPAVATAAAAAKDYTQEAAHQAGGYLEQVKPYLEQGREMAEKQAAKAKEQAESAKKQVANREGLAEFVASGAAAREIASQRSRDAALVLKGDAKVKRVKKGNGLAKVVVNLGVLTVVGALAAVVAQKLRQPKDDPWARPLTDPYVAPAKGRDSSTVGGSGVEMTDVAKDATSTSNTTGTGTGTSSTGTGTDSTVVAGPGAGTSTEGEIIPAAGQVPTENDRKN